MIWEEIPQKQVFSDDIKYCNFLKNKLHDEYSSANFTKFSEHSCLLNHLQATHSLIC